MSKMTINGSVIEIRDMNLKGGKLPESYSQKFDVDIDTEGAPFKTIAKYLGGGSSARVTLQKTLRTIGEKYGCEKLDEMAETVIEIHLSEVDDPNFFVSPAEKAKAMFSSMTPEQREELAKLLK